MFVLIWMLPQLTQAKLVWYSYSGWLISCAVQALSCNCQGGLVCTADNQWECRVRPTLIRATYQDGLNVELIGDSVNNDCLCAFQKPQNDLTNFSPFFLKRASQPWVRHGRICGKNWGDENSEPLDCVKAPMLFPATTIAFKWGWIPRAT